MYSKGDKIVHPMHGAGIIEDIVERKQGMQITRYYVLHLPVGGMVVMIPIESCESIGVRPVVDNEKADEVIASICDMSVELDNNWNKRYRENMLRIKSGDICEVARVVKSLVMRERERGLSTGERKMLHSAKQIFISEIVLAKSSSYEEVERNLETAVGL